MLSRLTDRIENGPDGKPVKRVLRYGLWGTSLEIEKRKKGNYVIVSQKGEVLKEFKTLEEAEVYLKSEVS